MDTETFSARIDKDIMDMLRKKAENEDRSINKTLNRVLREYFEENKQK